MIDYEDLTFTYPAAETPAIQNVNLHISPGEFVLIAGESGTGKSTFLRCLNGLVPHFSGGVLSGSIRVAGLDPVQASPKRMSLSVGFVFQDPESQFVMDTVEDDIGFTLENAGIPADKIHRKISEILLRLDLLKLRERKIHSLSGGERQKVAIASALVCSPPILALDEPTSQLDPVAANEILETILLLKSQLQLTVLLSEHRLDRVLKYADRLVYFSPDHQPAQSGFPEQVLRRMDLHPPLVAIGLRLGWQPLPLSVEQAEPHAARFLETRPNLVLQQTGSLDTRLSHHLSVEEEPVLKIEDLSVSLGKNSVLAGVNLELFEGEVLAVIGPNGVGKTTLLRTIVGLQKPGAGRVMLHGRDITSLNTADLCSLIGFLPQDPNALLFADSVAEELRVTLRNHRLPIDEAWINRLLSRLGIMDQAECYPRDLSVGQRQRVALGAIMITKPPVLLLDEPTRGMDATAKRELLCLLKDLCREGMSIMLVTHDVELAAAAADRVALMGKGRVEECGTPWEILPGLGNHAPQTSRLFPGSGWLTETDLFRSGMI
jgi:energy-coupling factor transport system ATP-binding protein